MMSKRKLWLLTGGVAMVLLAGFGLLAFFYLLPRHLRQNEFPRWLERNQSHFRVGGIKSGNYNRIEVEQLSIGDGTRPLLAAPNAVLIFDYPAERNFGVPRFRELRLLKPRMNLEMRDAQLLVNGYPAADFITALTELPPGPDGSAIPLLLDAAITTPGRADQPFACRIQVRREAEAGCFLFSGNWQAADGRTGEWEARLDRGKGEIVFNIQNELGILFLQEFLLRSGAPVPLAALFRSGSISGTGSFRLEFPALKVSHLRYAGTLRDGTLEWGRLKFQPETPVTFNLSGTPGKLEFKIPELPLQSPVPLKIQEWQLEYHEKSSISRFSGRIDFGPALVHMTNRRFGFAGKNIYPVVRQFTGSVDWQTGAWRCETAGGEAAPENWVVAGEAGSQLALNAENFTLSGEGVAERGSLVAQLKFKGLELKNSTGSWRSDRGELRANWRFGEGRSGSGDTFEFNFDKLVCDTPRGQLDLRNPAGELNVRMSEAGQYDFYLIARAQSYALLTPQFKLDSSKFQSEIVATRRIDGPRWTIQSCDFKTDDAIFRRGDLALQLATPELRGAGVFTSAAKPDNAELHFSARSIRSGDWNFTRPQLHLIHPDNDRAQSWRGNFEFSQGDVRILGQPWSAVDGKLELAGESFTALPDEFKFSAAAFKPVWKNWQGDFQNSSWQIRREPDTDQFACELNAEAFRVRGPAGSGNFAGSQARLHCRQGSDGKFLDFQAELDLAHPSWSYQTMHLGSETLKGHFAFRNPQRPLFQTALTAGNATLITPQFSLLAPQFELEGEHDAGAGATGHLRLVDGSVSATFARLDAGAVTLDLPWRIGKTPAGTKPDASGRLTVGRITLGGQNEGALEAVLTQNDEGIAGTGELTSPRLQDGKVKLETHIALPPRNPQLELAFDLAPASLAGPLDLSNWYSDCPAVITAGKFSLHGVLKSDFETAAATGTVSATDSDWMLGNGLLEGAAATVEFHDLIGLISRPDVPLTAKRFKWKNWEFRDNRFQLTFNAGHEVSVSAWEGSSGGGNLRLTAPVRFQTAGQNEVPLMLAVSQMPLAPFLTNLGIDAMEGGAVVSGTVNAKYADGTLNFGDSSLGFKTPSGELLKFGALERYVVKVGDPNYQAFTLAVLRAMRCTSAQFDFADRDGALRMKIKADGVPDAPVPFVYQGKDAASPFRPASSGEEGFSGELELLVDLKLNADKAPDAPRPNGAKL